MAFTQEKIDRATSQSRGIFNKYVYTTTDTVAQVLSPGYFSACRFAVIDGPDSNSNGWASGIIEAKCSDGYVIGQMNGATGTLVNEFTNPTAFAFVEDLYATSPVDQIPASLGTPLKVTFGGSQVTPRFDVAVNGDVTCKVSGGYLVYITAQAGRVGAAGVSNLYMRLLLNGVQAMGSVHARLDNASTISPLRFTNYLNLAAGQIITAQIVQDSSGIAAGGLYATTPAIGWMPSPSVSIRFTRIVVA